MITAKECFAKYGDPRTNKSFLTMWDVPAELEIGVLPNKLYCNKDMVGPLSASFKNIIERGFLEEIKTWDGCFNIRIIRGYEKKFDTLIKAGKVAEANLLLSLHSWAIAIDINAFENGLGVVPKLSSGLVKCFTDAGFEWGGSWKRLDGMHFQLAKI